MRKKLLAQAVDFDQFYRELKTKYGIEFKLPGEEGSELSQATLGDIISALLPYLFTLAGLGLFIYLIIAGFGYMTSAGDPKKTQAAKDKLTNALVGFIIVFVAYWLIRILQAIFGLEAI